jgi:mannose-1-phosphate guanylyltransferase
MPVAQIPLIEYVLGWLRDGGVPATTICANGSTGSMRAHLGDGRKLGMSLTYHEDGIPRGAAGCVKDASRHTLAKTLVVADGTSIPVADLRALVAHHRRTGASVTIAAQRRETRPGGAHTLHPAGIYVFERAVLDVVPSTSFQDIKESLIPKLYRAGCVVEVFHLDEVSPRVLNADSYLAANHWMIERLAAASRTATGSNELMAHPTAWIDPTATTIGPVMLGPGVRVNRGALIVGPASLGAGTVVEADAVVARSVTWNDCVIGERSVVDQSVLADRARVTAGVSLSNAIRVGKPAPAPGVLDRFISRPKVVTGRADALAKPALS